MQQKRFSTLIIIRHAIIKISILELFLKNQVTLTGVMYADVACHHRNKEQKTVKLVNRESK